MRIGMMADFYKPHISGVTNVISLNKKYLEKLGHEVFVFTFSTQNKDHPYTDDELNVIRSPGISMLDTGFNFNVRYSKQARRLLQSMDLVNVHHPILSGPLAIRYCRSRGIPIVFTNHTRYDLYAQIYLPAFADVISETALVVYLPAFCRLINLVIAPSAGMQNVLQQMGVDAEIVIVPNGVDIQPFRSPDIVQNREDFGFKPNDILLIYFGRLGPEKNLPFLLRSFRWVAQAYSQVNLLLIGGGPEQENLKEMVQEMGIESRVRFTGIIPYELLPGYLPMADAFVTASISEVHPLSVIEAMASGLPVLGIQSPGVGDIVEDGITGYLVDGEDLASFTAKMVRIATDHDKRKQMGIEARKEADQYDIERTTKRLVDCYQQVISSNARRKRSWTMRVNRKLDRWRRS